MRSWLRTHITTATAILIALVLTVAFGFIAVESLIGALDPDRLGGNFGRGALSFAPPGTGTDAGGAAGNASGIIAAVIGTVVLVSAIIIVGLIFRREWAREAGLVIFGLLGLVATAVSLGGIGADPPAPSAWVGLLTGGANFAIVGLLWAPATARDFRRQRRRTASLL